MIERIFKNWKTSAIGLFILIISSVAVFTNYADLTEAGGFMVVAFGLFFAKDN